MVNENVITNKNSIVEMFNGFFVSVSPNLASKIRKGKRPFKAYLRESVVNLFFINPIQESEIKKLINDLHQNKSLCACSISVKILQNLADASEQSLTYLINLLFQQGIFSEALKTKRVTSVFKKRRSSTSF